MQEEGQRTNGGNRVCPPTLFVKRVFMKAAVVIKRSRGWIIMQNRHMGRKSNVKAEKSSRFPDWNRQLSAGAFKVFALLAEVRATFT